MLIYASNLYVANHVVFVSPYHTKGSHAQQTYDAAMTQAIGRARRFGQMKKVHIYHFVAAHTVDVDVLEKRTSKVLTYVANPHPTLAPYPGFKQSPVALIAPVRGASPFGEYTSSVAHLILPAGSP